MVKSGVINRLPYKLILAFSLFFSVLHMGGVDCFAQQAQTGTDKSGKSVKSNFINLEYISFSPDFTLGDNASFIVFKIQNNSARPIANIFAWVYRIKKGKNKDTLSYLLANNPNKGGILVNGGTHAPGEIAEWRFPLTQTANPNDPIDPNEKYTLRVSPKSIFFGDNAFVGKKKDSNKTARPPQ